MTNHWKQKQQSKGRKGLQAATAPTTRATSSSTSSTSATAGMDDLPDELLDDIALFAEQEDLPNLALVERRWYAPARKQTSFAVEGFDNLLLFADMLLERPYLATLVRHVNLDVASPSATSSVTALHCSDVESRITVVIVHECPNLRTLKLGVPPRSATAQAHLMTAVGQLRHLSHTVSLAPGYPINFSAFVRAAPAFQTLQEFQMGFDLRVDALPASLPVCNIADICLCLRHCSLDDLEALLTALASQSHSLTLSICTYGHGDKDWTQPARRTRLNAILHPFIAQAEKLAIALCTFHQLSTSPHLLDWPARRGGVCLYAEEPIKPAYSTFWWIGDARDCQYQMWEQLVDLRVDVVTVTRKRAWAKRGNGWTSSHVEGLEALCSANGVALVWE